MKKLDKEEIQILLQYAEEAKDVAFSLSPVDWENLNFLAGKIFAYKNVLTILEEEKGR